MGRPSLFRITSNIFSMRFDSEERKNMKRAIIFALVIGVFATLSACGNLMEPSGFVAASPMPSATMLLENSTPSVTPSVTVASLTPSSTATPDLCSTSNLPNTIKPVNDLTRQFDDYSALARSAPQSQMMEVIPPLQSIRRTAEDQVLPACLQQLKSYQISYMDTFIQTTLAFESISGNPNGLTAEMAQAIKTGMAQAEQYHDQYLIEMARLLGVTVVPSSTPILGIPNPGVTGTSTSTPLPITITNPGTGPINLHSSPSLTSSVLGKLDVGAAATAIGKSADGDWLLIQIPKQTGKTAWLYTSLINFYNGDINSLPVATPTS